MTQVLDFPSFSVTAPAREGRAPRDDDDAFDDPWQDVSCRTLPDDAPVDPANTPRQVLFEAFLVLAAAIGAVAVVTLLVPGL